MSTELTCDGKLSKAMTYHVLRTEDRDEILSIVDTKGQTHKFRRDNTRTGPGSNNLLGIRCAGIVDFLHDARIYVESFF